MSAVVDDGRKLLRTIHHLNPTLWPVSHVMHALLALNSSVLD